MVKKSLFDSSISRSTRLRLPLALGIDLKKAAKSYSSKFACGASVVKNASNVEEIVIQGDVPDRVSELILKDHGDKINKELITFVVK